MSSAAKKPGFFARISRSVKDMAGEMKKVVWPSKKQTLNNSGIVIVFMVVMAIVVALLDLGMGKVLQLLFGSL